MIIVRCIKKFDLMKNGVREGKLYWMDADTEWYDPKEDKMMVHIYLSDNRYNRVGGFPKELFEPVFTMSIENIEKYSKERNKEFGNILLKHLGKPQRCTIFNRGTKGGYNIGYRDYNGNEVMEFYSMPELIKQLQPLKVKN